MVKICIKNSHLFLMLTVMQFNIFGVWQPTSRCLARITPGMVRQFDSMIVRYVPEMREKPADRIFFFKWYLEGQEYNKRTHDYLVEAILAQYFGLFEYIIDPLDPMEFGDVAKKVDFYKHEVGRLLERVCDR